MRVNISITPHKNGFDTVADVNQLTMVLGGTVTVLEYEPKGTTQQSPHARGPPGGAPGDLVPRGEIVLES